MTRLQTGTEVDGFAVGERLHAGGMADLYRVHYVGGRADPGFPMAMKVPRMGGGVMKKATGLASCYDGSISPLRGGLFT